MIRGWGPFPMREPVRIWVVQAGEAEALRSACRRILVHKRAQKNDGEGLCYNMS